MSKEYLVLLKDPEDAGLKGQAKAICDRIMQDAGILVPIPRANLCFDLDRDPKFSKKQRAERVVSYYLPKLEEKSVLKAVEQGEAAKLALSSSEKREKEGRKPEASPYDFLDGKDDGACFYAPYPYARGDWAEKAQEIVDWMHDAFVKSEIEVVDRHEGVAWDAIVTEICGFNVAFGGPSTICLRVRTERASDVRKVQRKRR